VADVAESFHCGLIGDAYAVPPTTGTHNNWNPGLAPLIRPGSRPVMAGEA